MRNIDVPAPTYDEALAFCNARRAEKDLPPIDALPAGYPKSSHSCPCANAVPGLDVGSVAWCWEENPEGTATAAYHPTRFVSLIDTFPSDTLIMPVRVP